MKDYQDQTFVIFDVETTGLSPENGDRIVEIAALRFKNFQVEERFETLINPERPIAIEAYLVNGISELMVAQAPRMRDIMDRLLTFIADAYLVAHNLKFDLGFLNRELHIAGSFSLENLRTLDTLKMAKSLLPSLGSYSLKSVAYYLQIREIQKHRAMADVEMTFEVFKRLLTLAQSRGIDDFSRWQYKNNSPRQWTRY